MDWKKAIIIALYFGIFQALMPILGYFLGSTFSSFVQSVDHWIAFCTKNPYPMLKYLDE